jgi:autotransporter adhesin
MMNKMFGRAASPGLESALSAPDEAEGSAAESVAGGIAAAASTANEHTPITKRHAGRATLTRGFMFVDSQGRRLGEWGRFDLATADDRRRTR